MEDANIKYSYAGMSLLKANLGYYGTDIPPDMLSYLQSLMTYAWTDFLRMGIRLKPGEISDDMDQVTFAAWMYRKGVNGEGKTQMLKDIIRNRQVLNATSEEVGA